jgi:hypothetical protein
MFCQKCGKEASPEMEFCGSCGASLKTPTPSQPIAQLPVTPKAFEFSDLSGLTVGYSIVVAGFLLIMSTSAADAMVNVIVLVLSTFFGYYAAANFAPKIKGSINWAFAIPFSFGIIGYICYWIYYLNKRSNMTNL